MRDDDFPPGAFAVTVVVGGVAGAMLGKRLGGAGGELGPYPTGWQLGVFPLLPLLLAAAWYSLARGSGVLRSVVLSPVVAVAQTGLTLAWFAGKFLIVLPALGVFGFLYEVRGWTQNAAILAAVVIVVPWALLLSRLPVAPLIDAFYDSGAKASALWGGALFAIAPALILGALLGYYLGYLDDMSWQGGERQGRVGAILGGIYGLSVGFLVPFTTMGAMMLGEPDD